MYAQTYLRWLCAVALLVGLVWALPLWSTAQPKVAVVVRSDVAAYQAGLSGFRSVFGDAASTEVSVIDLSRKDASEVLKRELEPSQVSVVVAVGPEAWTAVSSLPAGIPVVATFLLKADLARTAEATGKRSPAATLSLDIPGDLLLKELRRAFPRYSRLGVIRNPGKNGPTSASLKAAATQAGFSLQEVECQQPEHLVDAFLSFKNRVDFVWCLPDSDLYNAVTVRALLMASLANQLPVIGFSESFVRAGAIFGMYADFEAVGRQTASIVRMYLAGNLASPQQRVSTARISLNAGVARLLGMRVDSSFGPEMQRRELP